MHARRTMTSKYNIIYIFTRSMIVQVIVDATILVRFELVDARRQWRTTTTSRR